LNPNGEITMDDLLREAIADAKAVRETALENAKIALEEAFTPRLQSMLSKKIATEMEDSEEGEHEEGEHEEGEHEEGEHDAEEMRDSEEMRDKEEMEHDEMRDSEENEHEEMRDSEEEMDKEEEMDEAEDAEETEDSEEMREEEDSEENDDKEEEMEEAEDKEEDELDLESVLAELEADLNEEDKEEEEMDESEDKEEDEKMDENDVSSDIGKADNKVNPEAGDSSKTGAQGPEGEGSDKKAGTELGDHTVVKESEDAEEEDLDLDEVLRALTEEEDAEENDEKVEELQAELKETRQVVQFMRDKLNEVNLLNAKLLFSNKLFRAFGLNNNQKLKVVETFDRTKNLREVKLVYATLAESFKRPTSKIVESKGSSSKPVRSTKPAKQEVLSEGAELKARFKKLANIL
jgi:hypothetical protein